MSKQIAHVPLEQISRLEIVVTKCRKSLTEVKGETGADYILNGGMWNPDGSPCVGLKVGGTAYAVVKATSVMVAVDD